MSKSQHKETSKVCPVCKKLKLYPDRNYACSAECAKNFRRTLSNKEDIKLAAETRDESDNELVLSLNKTRVKSLEELIKVCSVDTKVWECQRFVANKWEVGANINNRLQTEELFQVKAWFKRKEVVSSVLNEIKAIKEEVKLASFGKAVNVKHKVVKDGVVLELSIPDLHLGKLAWSKETGWEDYDANIAKQCYEDAVNTLLSRSMNYNISEIVMVVGNDLLNYDNKAQMTTRGTPQTSSDTRYQKTFTDARKMVTDSIKLCNSVAPISVIMVPGNHDELSLWHLGDSLECVFEGSKTVSINNAPTLRKYAKFGQVGLMWTHGDKGKHDKYPLLFASERPDIWGTTKFHEVHVGHLHQTNVRELNGTRVRILPSLCAADAWHSEMTFVGNVRSAEAFVWDRREGLIGTNIYTVPDQGN